MSVNKKLIVDWVKENSKKVELELGQGEDLTYLLVAVGHPGQREIRVKLTGPKARAQILGVLIAPKGEGAVRIVQHHLAPETQSDSLIRSVVCHQARLEYRGLIRIEKGAGQSDAYQRNDNLIVGDLAQVKTRPELEILANDVRCGHGATVGKMNEEELLYLMSRGLSYDQAAQLVIEGFLEPILRRLTDQRLVSRVKKAIARR